MNPLIPKKGYILDVIDEIYEVKTYVISIEDYFNALPGQFNMVGYPGVGEAPISLSSLVEDKKLYHTIRSVGKVTRYLEHFKTGSKVFIRGPFGNGWPVEKLKGKDLVIVAGGLGVAPLRPVLQMVLNERGLYRNVLFIYGSRNEDLVLFKKELLSMSEKIHLYLTVDEVRNKRMWDFKLGLVTDIIEEIKVDREMTVALVCGPEMMMRFVCRQLEFKGINPSNIYVSMERRMRCGIGHCGHCQHYGLFVCKDGPVFTYERVKGLPDGLL
jgi:NAD(P)H-flavin reductase